MLKEVVNHHHHHHQVLGAALTEPINEAIYGSDEFRMYAYKIKRCPRTRSHDWTECPYAHRGEKAQRRDPLKFNYAAITCPAFRNGRCSKGDFCEFAHGVFEYWLHPARYRTRACNAGRYCQRKVCFFAHTPEQLRSETKYKCNHHAYRACGMVESGNVVSDGLEGATSVPVQGGGMVVKKLEVGGEDDGCSDFLMSLRGLKVSERESELVERNPGFDMSDLDLLHLGWISELVK